MTVFTGRVTKIEAGASAGSHTDITNAKFARWGREHTITPRNLPSSKIPVGYLQSHSHIKGEFALVSEAYAAFSSYISDTGDNTVIPFARISGESIAKVAVYWTFTGFIITHVEKKLEGAEAVFVYHFLAYSVVRGP